MFISLVQLLCFTGSLLFRAVGSATVLLSLDEFAYDCLCFAGYGHISSKDRHKPQQINDDARHLYAVKTVSLGLKGE